MAVLSWPLDAEAVWPILKQRKAQRSTLDYYISRTSHTRHIQSLAVTAPLGCEAPRPLISRKSMTNAHLKPSMHKRRTPLSGDLTLRTRDERIAHTLRKRGEPQHKTTRRSPEKTHTSLGDCFASKARLSSALRANPYPEVTDPACRLPLPTLFQHARGCSPWRPAADMGTARREIYTLSPGFSRASESSPDAAGTATLSKARAPLSGRTHSRAPCPSQRKENSPRGSRRLLRDRSRYRTGRLAAPISATPDSGI